MSDSKYKTMRHIETVRNYLNLCIKELIGRQESHDQSKFSDQEIPVFDEYTDKLRNCTYGSEEYKGFLRDMQPALVHHYSNNRHHPEYFKDGIKDMNLIDVLEMIVDWKCSCMRHNDGDIFRSIEINQGRFGYSDELKQIFINTAKWLNESDVFHKASES